MTRFVAQAVVFASEVERADGVDLIALTEKQVRRALGEGYDAPRVYWLAEGRGVNGHREQAWSPGAPVPWWARTLRCRGEVG